MNHLTIRSTRVPRRSACAAVIGAIVAVLVCAPAMAVSAAPHDDSVAWSVTPATDGDTDDRISLRHTLDPGERVEDSIAVTNQGVNDATFAVAPGDGVLGDNGAFDIGSDTPEAGGSWIELDGATAPGEGSEITVPAGETRLVPLTITVPDTATPGDHPAGIVVALAASGDQVSVTHRIGVRLHLRVAGDVAPVLTADGIDVTFTPSLIPFAPGTVRATVDVTNTGNVRLAPAVAVASTGAFGLLPSGGAASADELLPSGSTTLTVESEAWPLAVLFGSVQLSGSAVGEDGVASPVAVTESVVVPAVSWTGLAVVVLCVAGIVFWVRRRAARSGRKTTEEAPTSAHGATDVVPASQ